MQKKEHLIGRFAADPSIFVDSSSWIALFSARDQHHSETDGIFRSLIASRRQLLTTNLVLAEIHRLLLHRAGSRAAAVALEKIEASSLVKVIFANSNHHHSAKLCLERLQKHPISYADAVSFAVMEAAGCKRALSYDHHFQMAGFEIHPGSE